MPFVRFVAMFQELATKGTKITTRMLLVHDIGYPVDFVATDIFTTRFAGEHRDHGEKRVESNPASVTSVRSVVKKSLVAAMPRCAFCG